VLENSTERCNTCSRFLSFRCRLWIVSCESRFCDSIVSTYCCIRRRSCFCTTLQLKH